MLSEIIGTTRSRFLWGGLWLALHDMLSSEVVTSLNDFAGAGLRVSGDLG